jgi:hypothetical protein
MHKNPHERLGPGPAPDHDSGDGELPERGWDDNRSGGAKAVYGDGCDKVKIVALKNKNIYPKLAG